MRERQKRERGRQEGGRQANGQEWKMKWKTLCQQFCQEKKNEFNKITLSSEQLRKTNKTKKK